MSDVTIIARRSTFDDARVCLWSDGLLTWALGYGIKGVGTSRKPEQQELNLRAGWLVMGEVELYDAAEVSRLVKTARKAVRQSRVPAPLYLRQVMSGADPRHLGRSAASKPTTSPKGVKALGLNWAITNVDRDGKPTERTGTFPRLSRWSGVIVYDSRRDYGRQGGRYGIYYLTADRRKCRPGPPAYVAKTQAEIVEFLAL